MFSIMSSIVSTDINTNEEVPTAPPLSPTLVSSLFSSSFDDRPLPPPKPEQPKLPKSKSLTFIKPRDSIYVLLRDDEVVCFCATIQEATRTIKFYKDQLVKQYPSSLFTVASNRNAVNVYERRSNFFFNYDQLFTSFKIQKVPHCRTKIFDEKYGY